jgi:hypothetical protein
MSRSLAVPYISIVTISDQQLPPQTRHRVPSSTPMTDLDMDPNSIPDMSPTITHHDIALGGI